MFNKTVLGGYWDFETKMSETRHPDGKDEPEEGTRRKGTQTS